MTLSLRLAALLAAASLACLAAAAWWVWDAARCLVGAERDRTRP